jgi:hypothetical protein
MTIDEMVQAVSLSDMSAKAKREVTDILKAFIV